MKFWIRCAAAHCVVVPVMCYSSYGDDGNVHDDALIGLRFMVLPFDDCAVGPDYWCMIDEEHTGIDDLYQTPEEALVAYEKRIHAVSWK